MTVYTLEEARKVLETTEPLGQHTVTMLGSSAPKFSLTQGWNVGLKNLSGTALVDAYVKLGTTSYQLTKDAALEATTLIGLTKAYVERTPANLIEPHLNYWFSTKDEELKLLTSPQKPVALAFTKGSITPFSNLKLLEDAVDELIKSAADYSPEEIQVDAKLQHDLRLTRLRLFLPADHKIDDVKWSRGVQIQNSLVGEKPTSVRGFLRTDEGHGLVSTHAQSGNWNRRTGGQGDDVYDWARHAVDEILTGLDHELESIADIGDHALDQSLGEAIADVFTAYKVPMEVRDQIIQTLVAEDPDPLTMYDIMIAVSTAANTQGLSESIANVLMEIAGDLPLANSQRCNACHRLVI